MTRKHKVFAGQAVRRIRESNGMTQAALAGKLGISPSYLNQIEQNQRPLTAGVLVELSQVFRVDISTFSQDENDRLIAGMRQSLNDPVFDGLDISITELKAVSQHAPGLASAFMRLHQAHRNLSERHQALDEVLTAAQAEPNRHMPQFAYDEVRDFFHRIGNYVDLLDRAAEQLVERENLAGPDRYRRVCAYIGKAHKVRVELSHEGLNDRVLRSFDRKQGLLTLDGYMDRASHTFAVAHQIALLEQSEIIRAIIRGAGFRSEDAPAICELALANYFAAAILLPYRLFREKARDWRHDVERLAHHFEASLEQVCHRLSTLQRRGDEGVPFYFLRVDRAGNITKRHSATRLQFARYGGACPLWNIHAAFETPDRTLVDIVEMPDGVRYLSLSRAITKSAGVYGVPVRRYAIGLGCELAHADALVYSEGLDIKAPRNVIEIGVACRLCERSQCPQRAFPPVDRRLSVDPDLRRIVPYRL